MLLISCVFWVCESGGCAGVDVLCDDLKIYVAFNITINGAQKEPIFIITDYFNTVVYITLSW